MMNRLKDMREDRDLNQTEIAKLIHVHQTTYSDYERGNLNVPVSVLIKLADYYNTSIDYIVGRTDEIKPYLIAKK
ncbi:MAG: helix-turn-helix transcriptional regulator [Clostridia bacterium]|nr:helix-turn-helix transcriptional regulator [Clostridia bacterium]